MPHFDKLDPPKKGKPIKSAFDSESFDADGTIHVAGLVGSATISPSGRDVALASPEGLSIIDLDSPYNPPRRLSSHGSPWLVTDVQWSPFAARDYWVVSTANHRALVWNLNLRDDSTSGAIEHSLQGHSRAITDVNFSAHHPDQLASCAVDGYVHCWDLRRPRQPVITFCDWFAGATQVKYNRQDPHILASSHDRWLHIWDERRACEPLKSIIAHTSKIYGIDWNRTRSTGIVTCSLDKHIKFWDYGSDQDVPERVIRTEFPVWRARHTPFGRGLLAMPQNAPGDLYLYDRRSPAKDPDEGPTEPVAVFPGHGNHKVKEFLWRSRGSISDDGLDNRDFQLVSWGEDNELRLQQVDPSVLASVGYEKGMPVRKNLVLTRKGAAYKTFRTVEDSVSRDRRSATMSDPRTGSQYRQSALTMSMRSGPTTYSRLGAAWKGSSMKAKSASKTVDRSQAHIGWMKGIMMNKRKASTDSPRRADSKDSTMFSPGYMDDDKWGDPETIQEEFLRISMQLPKVKWENIDMDSLTLHASLNGPWGANGDTIFIKVRVDIPANYPKFKAPKFYIEKTSFMSEKMHKKIEHELQELCHQFLQQKQNCLDVAFSYLLGEIDLAASTNFFKNVKDLDDPLDGLASESSSEDENDIPAGGSASMSQELPPNPEADSTLAPNNRPTIPPLPRFCGARFANDGRLVCFFPTKEEKAKALLFAPVEPFRERPKGEPVFAGFGRLAHDSPPGKRYGNDEMSATDDQSDSDETDGSSSSSDSESTSINKMSLWYQPQHRFKRTWSDNRSVRSSGGGTGVGTGTGTGSLRRRPGKSKNVVSLHDLSGMLPAKKEFAKEYAIFGEGSEVCEHNAQVAEKHGSQDLVDIWRYLSLLLRKDIPLELLNLDQRHENHQNAILVIARDAISRFRAEGSPTLGASKDVADLNGRVKWGNHPLARDFINDLFEYFEHAADIQMLAMLSCLFSESTTEDSVAYAESHLTQPETPLPMKAPSFSLDYFPTDASLWNSNGRSQTNSAITTPRTLHTPIRYSGSQGSIEDALWTGDPGSNSYSCGETPPTKGFREYLGHEGDQTPSLSTSPNGRVLSRANSGLTSSFAINFPRPFSGVATSTATAASSPPNNGRKRPSPADTILSTLAPSAAGNVTWGHSTVMGEPGTARTSLSDDEVYRDDLFSLVPIGVSVQMEDQTIFDDDGWMSTPLLEPSRTNMYATYRYVYAEILQMWNQPLARLEIMKFNVLQQHQESGGLDESHHEAFSIADTATTIHAQPHHHQPLSQSYQPPHQVPHQLSNQAQPHNTSPILLGKKEQLQSLVASGRGLDVTGICRIHETQLEPLKYTSASAAGSGGAVGTCDRCRRNQTQLLCVYCREPVDALYPPCLGCGCAFHEACLAEWHAAGEEYCPAGDECNCVEEASNGQVESWAAMMGALRKAPTSSASAPASAAPSVMAGGILGRGLMLPPPAIEEPDDDEAERGDWESVASSAGIPSRMQGGGAVMSAARISLGNRLKKSAGDWSKASPLRKGRSGGVANPGPTGTWRGAR
ncbi:putative RWD, RING finger and WD repeat-containing protein [Colletotrichum orbiculare MAFF 240422]|uniref:RWD, RING finger and WD repeat-containing protein n=1 Tax=Colletotrichum orbiculare (strain 104-T / ATCC 96160 / CBS 514.97 / LARS 414 / MAFF 240422) TaxID=1213857 RepID=N4V9T1_COLOR|nr:putative RWD, RING finger and WD repeat-containing protein [Colletotrichum orbiculare MAFF 240422]